MHKPILPVAAALMLGCLDTSWAQGPLVSNLEPVRKIEARSLTEDDNKTLATNLSGVACMRQSADARVCLVIDDQGRFAQFAKLEGSQLIGGEKFRLIGDEPASSTLGKEPQKASCSEGKAKFKDLDGEAVAFAEAHFYVSGSHGCSRKSMKFRTSSFIVARLRVDDKGKPVSHEAETTYRLAEVLSTATEIKAFFGKDLTKANGLNVEGIAVTGGNFIAGLRGPVDKGAPFLVSVRLDHLFSRESPPPPGDVRVTALLLGKDMGVRDLAALSDGRLLVLAGPAQEQKHVPYSFFLVDPKVPEARIHLATIKDVVEDGESGKAEGVVVLDATADALRVLVVFDGLLNGGPREYRLLLH
jgi:hypothetical protein